VRGRCQEVPKNHGTIPSTPVVYNNDGDAPQPVAYDDFVGRVEYE